ncbi:uncharacterized protein LOC126568755 [Anopheles maculipalpis]|uniref:uncharacterized protein LOC126568755 n=1 Tax=Anopheles maculipalpis TaxID=1496333 RepID=UPI00215982CC|nr:uncharacterized protein LOC126568755 [Anopheles maculipalpis]
MDRNKESQKGKRKPHSNNQETSTSSTTPKLSNDTGAKRITPQHGISYQTECTVLVSLRAYEMQQNNDFNFTITLEDPQGCKFDDIVLRCASKKIALYMQCKHKMPNDSSSHESTKTTKSEYIPTEEINAQSSSAEEINAQNSSTSAFNKSNKKLKAEPSIVANAFLCPNGPFSIPMYFTSFLEMKPNLLDNYYFLCTNAVIDGKIIEHFSEIKVDPSENSIFSCYKELHGKFYELKKQHQLMNLNEKLKYASLSFLGKSLAECILRKDTISRTIQIYNMYAVLIHSIIERSDQSTAISSTSDKNIYNYKFNQAFLLAGDSTDVGKLREAFRMEYKKLLEKGKDTWEDIKEKGINMDWDSEMSAVEDIPNIMPSNQSSHFAMVERKIEEFYSKFRLICTPDEEKLRSDAKRLVSKLTDTEPDTTLTLYRQTIFEVYKEKEVFEINSNYLKGFFEQVKHNFAFTKVKTSTKEYTEILAQKFPHGLMNREWLISSKFYKFLDNNLASKCYCYRSTIDLNFSAMIILETLKLCKTECLFIHESSFHQNKALEEMIENVFKYIQADFGSTLYIIVILDKFQTVTQQSFNELLAKSHHQRLVVLMPLTEKEEPSEQSLLVRHLAKDARNQLYLENNQLYFFGAATSIGSMVQDSDDLSFMLKVLDIYSETKATDETNINFHNYEKIKNSYIQRDVEIYSPSRTPDSYSNREIKICFDSLKGSIGHRTYSFDEMINTFDKLNCKPINKLIKMALSKPKEEHNITDLLGNDGRNKCKVILNEAGFGKSTYLTWLAWRLSAIESTLFVVRLNAIEYSCEFHQLQKSENSLDDSELLKILYRFVSLALCEPNVSKRFRTELNEENRKLAASLLYFSNGQAMLNERKTECLSFGQLLELRLFCTKFNEKKLILLFDAYDEIFPNYTDIVLRCFAGFSKFDGIRNIYFSSRPHEFQDDFKTAITNCKIFQLKPFSHVHQILSLHKYILCEVHAFKNMEKIYQLVVLGVVYTVLINRLDDLVKTPLLLNLAIDAFLPIVKQNINFSEKTISADVFLTDKFQTFDIVKYFVHRKLNILNTKKSGSTDTATSTVLAVRKNKLFNENVEHIHAIMAIYVLFDISFVNKVIQQSVLLSAIEDIEHGEGKAGIIVEVKNNIPIFAHRTFAEYMAALWLFKNKDKLQTEPYFKSQMFWTRGFDRLRYFFNQMIVRENGNSEIHIAVLNKSLQEVKTMIENNSSVVAVKDYGGRIPVLLALQHDNHEIMLFLLSQMISINPIGLIDEKDNLFHWNALDYAFVIWNKNAIKALLEIGANIDIHTLRDQLFSNDNDNLLMQAYHYINQIASAKDREKLSKWTVKYLYNVRKVDINVQRERLERSTILHYCVAKNAYELFEQFILQLDNPGVFLSSMGNHLIKAALAKKAYNMVCFLIDKFGLQPPQIRNKLHLLEAVKSAIEMDRIVSLQAFLEQLCSLFSINCAKHTTIVVDHFENNIRSLHEDQMPKSCCVRKPKDKLSLPEYKVGNVLDKVLDKYLFESLLATAAHAGNVRIMSCIVRKLQKPITNRTIATVMRLLPKGKRLVHNQSVHAFKFLLDRTTDLNSVDEHGQNLLHMIIQNGCFFMAQCLLDSGFDCTLVNERDGCNIFHYIAASESKYNNRAFKLYELFTSVELTNHLNSVDKKGNNVCETAVLNNNFDIARETLETSQIDPGTSKRVEFVLKTVDRLVNQPDKLQAVLEFLKYLFEFGDIAWMKTYSTIRQSVPIV